MNRPADRSVGKLIHVLAAAGLAMALVSTLALVRVWVDGYRGPELPWLKELGSWGEMVWWASILYLLVTAGVLGRLGLMLKRQAALPAAVAPLVGGGHLAVALTIALSIRRQTHSLALLAELEQVLTLVGVVAILSTLFCLVLWWALPSGQQANNAAALPATHWIRWTIQIIACLLVAISLILLESHLEPSPQLPLSQQIAAGAGGWT